MLYKTVPEKAEQWLFHTAEQQKNKNLINTNANRLTENEIDGHKINEPSDQTMSSYFMHCHFDSPIDKDS